MTAEEIADALRCYAPCTVDSRPRLPMIAAGMLRNQAAEIAQLNLESREMVRQIIKLQAEVMRLQAAVNNPQPSNITTSHITRYSRALKNFARSF
jgi:phage host-nuclease inhibitor protein Gam